MYKRICIVFLLLLSHFAFSQTVSKKITINWEGIKKIYPSLGDSVQYLSFTNVSYDAQKGQMPVYSAILPGINSNIGEIYIKGQVYVELNDQEAAVLSKYKNDIPLEINSANVTTVYQKKLPYTSYSFVPFRLNETNRKYERLTEFEIVKVPSVEKKQAKGTTEYASNSVLSTGKWYKIAVSASGIYKLTYNDIVSMGLTVSDPRNIRIYGNGGGILPENNSAPRIDDLYENAIFVYGESDGSFDPSDYILFYGEGPVKWSFTVADSAFHHQTNYYSDITPYFVTCDLGSGKRVSSQASTFDVANFNVSNFNDYQCHEKDSVNLVKSGKEWYGENFDILTSYTFKFPFQNIVANSKAKIKFSIAARNTSQSNFTVNANGTISTAYVQPYSGEHQYATETTQNFSLTNSNSDITVSITKNTANAVGWLNYIDVNVLRNLSLSGNQTIFRNIKSVAAGNVSEFLIDNVTADSKVWEITNSINVKEQQVLLAGNSLKFRLHTDTLREFIVFSGSNFSSPQKLGLVENQNLHALSAVDLIIVSHPDFLSEAARLASIHYNVDNYSYVITTPQKIYNEFSSGKPDITAIKDFVKMFYDKANSAGDLPKYLLLFGDASYDYKNRINENTNLVPTYQSPLALDYAGSYASDDIFGFLDPSEGPSLPSMLDIGIGRFPVKTLDEASSMVDKVAKYTEHVRPAITTNGCSADAVFSPGDWRNMICFVADDEEGNSFVTTTESFSTYIDTTMALNNYNIDKIYADSYVQQTGAGGQRYPDVNLAINKRVEKGALIINYVGHGGEVGWALERILEVSDIKSWSNINNMPLFVTATCEFSRFDDPVRTSAGEYVLLNENGGGIALFTTSRLAWTGSNETLNRNFYTYALKKYGAAYPTLGELVMLSKNAGGFINDNIKNFVLLGDPALKLCYPENTVATTMINQHIAGSIADTLKAFDKVAVSGIVQNEIGVKLTDFNGIITPTVYDKKALTSTLGNDPTSPIKNYLIQKNILYKGKVSVTNGDFSFTFIVPKDIAYNYGIGRISYYAEDGLTDASGFYENQKFIIGGSGINSTNDTRGPQICLYLNDSSFVNNGITNEKPILLAYLVDSSGINTVGNGIGHDIVATIDNATEGQIILNDYYQADLNSYQSGTIRYKLDKLEEGAHTLTLKVWDIYNNSSEATLDFVVQKEEEMALKHVFNYPNPFTTHTSFFFEHNQPCCGLLVQIQIFTITGKLIKTIAKEVQTTGFRADPIEWDGLDDFGDNIGKGVYIYKLKVQTQDGSSAEKIEKLVIIK